MRGCGYFGVHTKNNSCKYIIYIFTYLNIFTNIPNTIHYTVFFFSRKIGRVHIKNGKRNASILQNKQESHFYNCSFSYSSFCFVSRSFLLVHLSLVVLCESIVSSSRWSIHSSMSKYQSWNGSRWSGDRSPSITVDKYDFVLAMNHVWWIESI